MGDNQRQLTTPEPEDVIKAVKRLHPSLEYACFHGSCYRFYEFLKLVYPEAEPYINEERSHVVSRIGDDLFDISGRVGSAMGKAASKYHKMSPDEIRVASKWRSR